MSSKINILRNIQNKKNGGLEMSNKIGETIAIVSKGNATKYINQSEKSKTEAMKIDNNKYIMEAYIPLHLERIIAIISGASGNGKSLIASLLTKQYMKHFKNNKIYFVSQTNYKDDINLKELPFVQLPTEEIDTFPIEDYKNSLVVFDDNDFHIDAKKIMKFLSKIIKKQLTFQLTIDRDDFQGSKHKHVPD